MLGRIIMTDEVWEWAFSTFVNQTHLSDGTENCES